MCTVSIVPLDEGFRLVCNRDERRERSVARPPRVFPAGDRCAVYPLDPQGGGTWAGVNDAGLAATVLNRTLDPSVAPRRGVRSRGAIVPAILAAGSLREALATATTLEAGEFNAFRLVVIQRQTAFIVTSDGGSLSHGVATVARPLLFTSSSLGDAVVAGPRRRLFERLVAGSPADWISGQELFHEHQWPDDPEISVLMERADARTVSRTIVNVTGREIALAYEPLGAQRQTEAA